MEFFSYLWEKYIEPVYEWVMGYFNPQLTYHHQVHQEPQSNHNQVHQETPKTSVAKITEEHRRGRNPVRPSKHKCQDCPRICIFICIHCNAHLCSDHWDESIQCPICETLNTKQYIQECYQKDICKLNVDAYDCFLSNCKHMYHRKCLDAHFNDFGRDLGCFYCTTKFKINEDVNTEFAIPPGVK